MKFDPVEEGGTRFAALLDDMLLVHQRELAAAAVIKARLDHFTAQRTTVEAHLLALVTRTEGEINKKEDVAKVEVQTGTATVDSLGNMVSDLLTESYPVVQYANKLLAEIGQINEAVEGLFLQVESRAFDALEQRIRGTFKTIGAMTRKLAGRLRDEQGRAELDGIRQRFAALEDRSLQR